jgi:hypothetical protein
MKTTLPTTSDRVIRNNLEAWYAEASKANIKAGKRWYKEAQAFTKKLSKRYGIDSYKVAGVVSALSPNNKWERNKHDAEQVIKAYLDGKQPSDVKVCTYNNNKLKAFGIIRGDETITGKSPKTHSFAMNVGLCSPDHITIDKWHCRACLCKPQQGVTETQESPTSVQYRRVEAITAELAHKHKLKGYEFQAIIWLTIKQVWER